MIVPSGVPADERSVPLNLTSESSALVGQIHSEFTARLAFMIFQTSVVQSRLIEQRRSLKLAKAIFFEKNKGEGDKKYELDNAAILDPEIGKIDQHIMELESELAIMEGVIGGYVKIQEGASREMSRRQHDARGRGD